VLEIDGQRVAGHAVLCQAVTESGIACSLTMVSTS
jgi:hypothetical protein